MPTKAGNTTNTLLESFSASSLLSVIPDICSLSKEHRFHRSAQVACLARCLGSLALVFLLEKRIVADMRAHARGLPEAGIPGVACTPAAE